MTDTSSAVASGLTARKGLKGGVQVKGVGITDLELAFHAIPVPLPILLLDGLVPLERLDKLAVYQCNLQTL